MWFGDHFHSLHEFNQVSAADGLDSIVLVKKTLNAQTATYIEWAPTEPWGGTHVPGTPVTLLDASDGTMRLFYSEGGSSAKIDVDKSIAVTANHRLFYGVPIVDAWIPSMHVSARISELVIVLEPYISSGSAAAFVFARRDASSDAWTSVADWCPISGGYERIAVMMTGRNVQIRFVFPAAYGTGSNLIAPLSKLYDSVEILGNKLSGRVVL